MSIEHTVQGLVDEARSIQESKEIIDLTIKLAFMLDKEATPETMVSHQLGALALLIGMLLCHERTDADVIADAIRIADGLPMDKVRKLRRLIETGSL